jgi:hypothetical protein
MYDSTKETKLHIQKVSDYLDDCIFELSERQVSHDWDKIGDPVEKELFDTYTPKLKNCTYGSDEYKSFLEGLKPALERHYSNNRHHPEHFENGIKGMNLIDLLEMICDWKASSERHADGNIFNSIEVNQKRFGYSDDLKEILKNTVDFLIEEKEE